MANIKFGFNLGDSVKVGRKKGVIFGLAVMLQTREGLEDKRCWIRIADKFEWYGHKKVKPLKEDVKTCQKRAHHPMAIKIAVKVADNPGVTTTELVEIVRSPRTSISAYLSRLRHAGRVESVDDLRDKRIQRHSLTDIGREWLDGVAEKAEEEETRPKEENFFDFKTSDDFSEPDNSGDSQEQLGF